jgi:hypothetical protein
MKKEQNFDKPLSPALRAGDVMPRFSVSLVYTKNIPNGIEIALRVLITKANSSQEALGKGIECFEKEMKGFNISNKVVFDINEDNVSQL